jgi:hypothetical protein
LVLELEPKGALAEHDVWVVVGRDQAGARGLDDFGGGGLALDAGAPAEDDMGAIAFCSGNLGGSRNGGHDDVGGDVVLAGSEGECLGVIAW